MSLRIGSLFSGYGGLDLALREVFPDSETTWVCDVEPEPCKILAERFPGIPNLGDITAVDWETVEPVDIIIGGSPCQDLSMAGRRDVKEASGANNGMPLSIAVQLLPTPTSERPDGCKSAQFANGRDAFYGIVENDKWGEYSPAITRWEQILGRAAPSPTQPGRTGKPALSPRFVEWMMGLPEGWATDIEISRAKQLRALGNGVVPQQAARAIKHLVEVVA